MFTSIKLTTIVAVTAALVLSVSASNVSSEYDEQINGVVWVERSNVSVPEETPFAKGADCRRCHGSGKRWEYNMYRHPCPECNPDGQWKKFDGKLQWTGQDAEPESEDWNCKRCGQKRFIDLGNDAKSVPCPNCHGVKCHTSSSVTSWFGKGKCINSECKKNCTTCEKSGTVGAYPSDCIFCKGKGKDPDFVRGLFMRPKDGHYRVATADFQRGFHADMISLAEPNSLAAVEIQRLKKEESASKKSLSSMTRDYESMRVENRELQTKMKQAADQATCSRSNMRGSLARKDDEIRKLQATIQYNRSLAAKEKNEIRNTVRSEVRALTEENQSLRSSLAEKVGTQSDARKLRGENRRPIASLTLAQGGGSKFTNTTDMSVTSECVRKYEGQTHNVGDYVEHVGDDKWIKSENREAPFYRVTNVTRTELSEDDYHQYEFIYEIAKYDNKTYIAKVEDTKFSVKILRTALCVTLPPDEDNIAEFERLIQGGGWTVDNNGYPPFANHDPNLDKRCNYALVTNWKAKWSFKNGKPRPLLYKELDPQKEYGVITWWDELNKWVIERYSKVKICKSCGYDYNIKPYADNCQKCDIRTKDWWKVSVMYEHCDGTTIGTGKNKNLPLFADSKWIPFRRNFKEGEIVEGLWGNTWYPAKIVSTGNGDGKHPMYDVRWIEENNKLSKNFAGRLLRKTNKKADLTHVRVVLE